MRGLAILLMVTLSLTAPPAGAQSGLQGIVLTEGGGFALATGRGGEFNWHPWMAWGGTGDRPELDDIFPLACYLAVYLDGIRIWVPGSKEPPNMDDFPVVSLQAAELYRGPSEGPRQYQTTGAACGAISLWTRTGEP